jgi:hypothetical protein
LPALGLPALWLSPLLLTALFVLILTAAWLPRHHVLLLDRQYKKVTCKAPRRRRGVRRGDTTQNTESIAIDQQGRAWPTGSFGATTEAESTSYKDLHTNG